MDAFAVELDRELPPGTPVTIVGDGVVARGARARRRHDHLRARLAHRVVARARDAYGGGGMSSKAERFAALQAERAADLAHRVHELLPGLTGDERALDVGAGTGALAHALAPRVREVVALEIDEAMAERARADAPRERRGRGRRRRASAVRRLLLRPRRDAPDAPPHPAARAPDRRAGPRGATAAGCCWSSTRSRRSIRSRRSS